MFHSFLRHRGRLRLINRLPLHVLAVGICLVLVKVSVLDDLAWTISQQFARVEPSDLGVNILRLERPPAHRVAGLSFNYKGDRATDVYLHLGDQRYLAMNLPRAGPFQSTLMEGRHARPIAQFPRWTGETRFRVEADGVTILAGSREIGRVAQTIPADADLFVRFGPRMQSVFGTVPGDIRVSIEDTHTPGRLEVVRFSWLLYGLALLALTTTMAVVLVYFPLTAAALILNQRSFRFVRVAVLILLPFWPPVLLTTHHIVVFQQGDQVLHQALQQIQDTNRPTANRPIRILLIGGSAGQGVPFSTADSVSGQLERIASKQGIPLEVVNLSRGGWDIVRWAGHVPEVLDSTQPDLAIAYLNFNSLMVGLNRLPTFVYPGLYYYRLLNHLLLGDWFLDRERLPAVLAAYETVIGAARARSIPLVILDDPVDSTYLDSYTHWLGELITFLAEQGVPIVPLYRRFQEDGAAHWYYDLCHLTRTGYTVAAGMTWEFLVEHDLLPAPHLPSPPASGPEPSSQTQDG